MKLDNTIKNRKITNLEEAKAFIDELKRCGKIFHFDDSPYDVGCFDQNEAHHVNSRVIEMFKLNLDWGEYEDPYGYAMHVLYH